MSAPRQCEDCGRMLADAEGLYSCEKCNKEVCSDCSENASEDVVVVYCLRCCNEEHP